MGTLAQDSRIIQRILEEYASIPYSYGELERELVFDCERHRYLLMVVGWLDRRRVHHALIHVDIVGDQIWIQYDGTEEGIADELVEAGIPKERIGLGFHPDRKRPLTGYAVA